jgi:hypothetical protein
MLVLLNKTAITKNKTNKIKKKADQFSKVIKLSYIILFYFS